MFLSIIIPVYNSEKYLDECIRSCLSQDINQDEYQIICVNDGSKDNSLEILKGYAENYPNVIIFNQENSGVSVARNNGLKLAKGEYVWFVDSDDLIRPNCLNELKLLTKEDFDIIDFGGYKFDLMMNDSERELLNKNQLKANQTYWGYCMFRVYKKRLIENNNIFFNAEIKYGEDEVFVNDVIEHCKKTYKLKYTNYLYRNNPDSVMSTLMLPQNQIKRLESVIISMIILKQGIEKGLYTKEFSQSFLKKRYELVQYCFKRIDMKTAQKYFNLMKSEKLFSYDSEVIKKLGLPSRFTIETTYLKQRFKIWSKSFYKKSRTKIKNLLPQPVVRIIKNFFRMPED